jgi:CRP/FNR family transcriptional regulator
MMHPRKYGADTILFSEGHPLPSLFVIHSGRVRLSISSIKGKRLTLQFAADGDVLGLSSLFSQHPSEVTAETVSSSTVSAIRCDDVRRFLDANPSAFRTIAAELCNQLQRTNTQLGILGLQASVQQKLARMLLHHGHEPCCTFSLTHEEIGEQIGTTRETVNRTLGVFRRLKLVQFDGVVLKILGREALQGIALGG